MGMTRHHGASYMTREKTREERFRAPRFRPSRLRASIGDGCTGCGGSPICMALCPVDGALVYEVDEDAFPARRVRVNPELCIGCGLCAIKRFESAVIDQDECEGCQDCIEECLFDAIELAMPERVVGATPGNGKNRRSRKSRKLKARIDSETCRGCGACAIACLETGALSMRHVRREDYPPVEIEGCPWKAVDLVPVDGLDEDTQNPL